MKRKDFLKRLGLMSAVAVTTPILVSELLKEDRTSTKNKFIRITRVVSNQKGKGFVVSGYDANFNYLEENLTYQ